MKTSIVKEPKLTGENFEQVVWETLLAVKSGNLKPAVANAVAALARAKISNQKIKLEVYKMLGKNPPVRMLD